MTDPKPSTTKSFLCAFCGEPSISITPWNQKSPVTKDFILVHDSCKLYYLLYKKLSKQRSPKKK